MLTYELRWFLQNLQFADDEKWNENMEKSLQTQAPKQCLNNIGYCRSKKYSICLLNSSRIHIQIYKKSVLTSFCCEQDDPNGGTWGFQLWSYKRAVASFSMGESWQLQGFSTRGWVTQEGVGKGVPPCTHTNSFRIHLHFCILALASFVAEMQSWIQADSKKKRYKKEARNRLAIVRLLAATLICSHN